LRHSVVLAEYWGPYILHEPRGPNIGGSSLLDPVKSAPTTYIHDHATESLNLSRMKKKNKIISNNLNIFVVLDCNLKIFIGLSPHGRNLESYRWTPALLL